MQGLFDPILRHVGVDLQTNRWLGLVAGRVYMNVTTTVEVLRSLPGPSSLELNRIVWRPAEQWAAATPSKTVALRTIWEWLRLPRLLAFMVRVLFHATDRSSAAFMTEWRQRADELTNVDTSAMSDEQLAAFIPDYLSQICGGVGDTSGRGRSTGMHWDWPRVRCGGLSPMPQMARRPDGTLANRLLSGTGGMDSAESALDLWRLAELGSQESHPSHVSCTNRASSWPPGSNWSVRQTAVSSSQAGKCLWRGTATTPKARWMSTIRGGRRNPTTF